jgi:SOS response regulatory protein OraA/RecX
VDEIYAYTLKLLKARDYTVAKLREKVEAKFGSVPEPVIEQLVRKNFLNDRRFTENYVRKRKDRGPAIVRTDLIARGVAPELVDEILSRTQWPSLQEALAAKMNDWHLHAPLESRDAARLFRALARLGYDEDAIREELGQLQHEQ